MPITLPTTIRKAGSANLAGDVTLSAGSGVTLTQSGNDISIASSGGGGGSNSATVDVDFGFASGGEGDIATASVTAAWVATTSKIVCTPFAVATSDHDPDDYAIEGIQAYATNIQDGVGFDVIASAPNSSFGVYTIHCLGVA